MKPQAKQPKLGIIAGSGMLPERLIRFCQQTNRPFCVVALRHHAEKALLPKDCLVKWCRVGSAGQIFRFLKKNDVQELIMIGGVRRPSVWELCPDFMGLKLLAQIGLSKKGDDGVLRDVIRVVEKYGFKVRGIHELMPELLAPVGVLTACKPTEQNLSDIKRGCYAAKLLGLADVGQSVIVQNGLVLSVEGIEGTEKLILRSKDLRRKGKGGVLVKMIKPKQEVRADMPTIGVKTIETIAQIGLSGIAVEAEKVLITETDKVVAAADKAGVFIVGVQAADMLSADVLQSMDTLYGQTAASEESRYE